MRPTAHNSAKRRSISPRWLKTLANSPPSTALPETGFQFRVRDPFGRHVRHIEFDGITKGSLKTLALRGIDRMGLADLQRQIPLLRDVKTTSGCHLP